MNAASVLVNRDFFGDEEGKTHLTLHTSDHSWNIFPFGSLLLKRHRHELAYHGKNKQAVEGTENIMSK